MYNDRGELFILNNFKRLLLTFFVNPKLTLIKKIKSEKFKLKKIYTQNNFKFTKITQQPAHILFD